MMLVSSTDGWNGINGRGEGTRTLFVCDGSWWRFVASPHGTLSKPLVNPRNLGGILGRPLVPWGSAYSGEAHPGFLLNTT